MNVMYSGVSIPAIITRDKTTGAIVRAESLRFIPMRNILTWQQLRDRRATPQIVDVAA